MKANPQFLALTVAALLTPGSLLASQVVTNTNNTGAGSLRQAIANAGPGEAITFHPSLDGQTITLTSGQLIIDKNLVIDASALPGGITVQNGSDRMFQIEPSRTVTMKSLTLANGQCPSAGGAILNRGGTLTLNRCRLVGNTCANDGGGGAILNDTGASLTLFRCVLTGNNANGEPGGAIATRSVGTVVINSCTIAGNSCNASGGAINNLATMTILNSTVSGNAAVFSGAIDNFGTLDITNSTFTGNTADNGGAIYNNDTLTLNHSTFSGNSALAAGAIATGGTLTLINSIVAGNTASASNGPDVRYHSGTIITQGVNLISDLSLSDLTAGPTVLVGDPSLAPLGAYGGPTATMPPLPGSPAINAAAMLGGTPATDQRGLPRPSGTGPDIGSVETQSIVPRPDAKIRMRGMSAFKGDNIYRAIHQAKGQTVTTSFKKERTKKRVFYIALQNDGNAPDSLVVKGSRGNKRFPVKYILGGLDVTSEVKKGNFKTRTLAPGAEIYLKMVVRFNSAIQKGKPKQTFWVTARSGRDSGRSDTVRADLKSPRK